MHVYTGFHLNIQDTFEFQENAGKKLCETERSHRVEAVIREIQLVQLRTTRQQACQEL